MYQIFVCSTIYGRYVCMSLFIVCRFQQLSLLLNKTVGIEVLSWWVVADSIDLTLP